MARDVHPLDQVIIKKLQSVGFIKSEADAILKRDVYQLESNDIAKIKNYATHFGLSAKERLIDEILELRREALLSKLTEL
ncbi:hypothetical protein ACODM8_11285 [Vibrio ostreicida]|uniref:Uncharacterized protein n=1 Tax=Vibrio ostreicida TaxID=526588 RepID=A0ABT8C068_9VIBR|nr:hypothetical protein [Vibrio ostreicida]MDN3612328.1 hypothetical protein [Vibrio ostreicida]NPD08708.1 hypothetical protein [Vibrio ostreicida]